MAKAKPGDTVRVHYVGKLEDGTEFDSSRERDPLQFTIGEQQVIPGFEEAVVGMEPGQKKIHVVGPEKGYGERREDLMLEVDRKHLPQDLEPEVGVALEVKTPDGRSADVRIARVGEKKVTLDVNHPLAGQTLVFDIELVGIGEGGLVARA